jgi:hypothetical protein
MTYMGMFHSDETLADYEDDFFDEYEYDDAEIYDEERHEADKYIYEDVPELTFDEFEEYNDFEPGEE